MGMWFPELPSDLEVLPYILFVLILGIVAGLVIGLLL